MTSTGKSSGAAASHTRLGTTSSQCRHVLLESGSLTGRSFEDNEPCLKTEIPTENVPTETNLLSRLEVKEGHVVLRKTQSQQCRLCILGFLGSWALANTAAETCAFKAARDGFREVLGVPSWFGAKEN